MGKKIGVVVAVLGGIFLLCCLGGFFFFRNVFGQLRETVKTDQTFVETALKATAKNWDEKDFAIYADESFNTPERKAETRKLFATLKEKLGPLVSLGEVKAQRRGGFHSVSEGPKAGFYVTFDVKAKFQKRDGVFEVTVRNNKDHHSISAISLNPDDKLSLDSSDSPSNNTP